MTIPLQIKSRRSNAKKSTGPKSTSGKLAARKNAVTHGVNAKTFINDTEENYYQTLVQELKVAYPSGNPLVNIQIERIANTKIQLDRVNKAIDATYAYAEKPSISDEALMDLLAMSPLERDKAQEICNGELTIDGIMNVRRTRVAAELMHIDTSAFKTHDEFLYHTPQLCKYVIDEASSLKQNIDYYITHNLSKFVNTDEVAEELKRMLTKLIDKNDDSKEDDPIEDHYGLPVTPTEEESIKKVKLENLKMAADAMRKEIDKLAGLHYKVITFNQLRKAAISPLTLDYGYLDRLQRYQTPLNNQLSKMMGELLALTK
jgi:hypothetical protein